ncbi:MAG TPA: RluA family pseudouridine synthase [Thermoflexales bacterium]|nr:RluA family pseudouridine synthase [Thermoflexales bacterium]HQZ54736.1 RluA family pseudouridine synthase [Thermoflexales bacterium]
MAVRRFQAPRADRLDKVVAAGCADLTRSAAQKLIGSGGVGVNGVPHDAGHIVRAGDWIEVNQPDPVDDTLRPEAIILAVLYEDADVLVINKPAGMVVHPGAGVRGGTVANAILSYAPETADAGDDPQRPGIVHRLDKETSGVLLIARTDAALQALQAQFQARTIEKTYLALCVGDVMPPVGLIDKPIGRDPGHRQRMAITSTGRSAQTEYTVTQRWSVPNAATLATAVLDVLGRPSTTVAEPKAKPMPMAYTLLRARPRTGRTHQLRVHLASIGFPIVGDETYGATRRDPLSKKLAPRQLLHASELRFNLPSTGLAFRAHAPLPADFLAVLGALDS